MISRTGCAVMVLDMSTWTKQGVVALISGDDEKDGNEEEEEIEDPQSSKCPITHGEAMNSMHNYLT